MKFRSQNEGVSPIVGVILMVAITVILSAIIATFVLDIGGTVSKSPQAGVSFDEDANGEVEVQLTAMENADSVTIKVSGSDYTGQFSAPGQELIVGNANDDSDGSVSGYTESGTANLESGDKITVTATIDGKTQVIQSFTYDSN